jgi:fatty acid desaturase
MGLGSIFGKKNSACVKIPFLITLIFLRTQILYPINSSYHLEHHLYPQLPWHSLKKFRHWAETNSEYKRLGSKLEAEAYFFGEKSIAKLSFPRSQANE